MDKDKHDKDENLFKRVPPILKNLDKPMEYEFDYEVNSIKLDNNEELNTKMYFLDKKSGTYRIVNYNSFWDSLNLEHIEEKARVQVKKNTKKAWCVKRLVSKKKRRFQTEQFDLDMAYITKRVLAMGYPSTGIEKFLRNSVDDVIKFFHFYHNDNVKIYNLCIEKERIYKKSLFNKSQVGLFPAKDHNPCPIKLILEFCVDICLYLIKNPDGIAAVHCKAGKGRTGVMICSYLIFSGLCKNSEEAIEHYARSRTYNQKGVTIPSQIRYIEYFESFLATNFCPPYIFLIPKIVKYHINVNTQNILKNFRDDSTYFISPNEFYLKKIKIGPIDSKSSINLKICDFINQDLKFLNISKSFEPCEGNNNKKNQFYFVYEIMDRIKINSDIKISVDGAGLSFYIWMNLWYSTFSLIKNFLERFHNDILEDHKIKNLNNIQRNNKKFNSIYNIEKYKQKKKQEEEEAKKNPQMKEIKNSEEEVNFFTMQNNQDDMKNNRRNTYTELEDIEDDTDKIKEQEKEFQRINTVKGNFRKLKSEVCLNEKNFELNFTEPTLEDNLFDIIYKLKHNTDMNILIKTINKILTRENKKPFNKDNLVISLYSRELDKFNKRDKVDNNFSVEILYSLHEE